MLDTSLDYAGNLSIRYGEIAISLKMPEKGKWKRSLVITLITTTEFSHVIAHWISFAVLVRAAAFCVQDHL